MQKADLIQRIESATGIVNERGEDWESANHELCSLVREHLAEVEMVYPELSNDAKHSINNSRGIVESLTFGEDD